MIKIREMQEWEEMVYNTGGASEETLLVEPEKIADELDLYWEEYCNDKLDDIEFQNKVLKLIQTLRGK